MAATKFPECSSFLMRHLVHKTQPDWSLAGHCLIFPSLRSQPAFRLVMLCLFYLQLSVFMLSSPGYTFATCLHRRSCFLSITFIRHSLPPLTIAAVLLPTVSLLSLLHSSVSPGSDFLLYSAHHSPLLSPSAQLPHALASYGFVGRGSRTTFSKSWIASPGA